MNIEERIQAFAQLGTVLSNFETNREWKDFSCGLTREEFNEFNSLICGVKRNNGWFTEDNVRSAIKGIVSMLKASSLKEWVNKYQFETEKLKNVGVIMAGNIPMVGFHDLLCVLVSGNKIMAKLSSDDNLLLPAMVKMLEAIEPRFAHRIKFLPQLKEIEAVIATGSDNSARYFKSYFGKYPNIIRKNRTSIALLDGSESEEELLKLGDDIFLYFGKGCRNITKIYLPEGYDLDKLFKAFYPHKEIIHHHKYANNYDYNKAIYLMNKAELIENGFVMLKQDESLYSPLSLLNYEFYKTKEGAKKKIENLQDKIQCVVGNGYVSFGSAQTPSLSDYADGVDTMQFLLSLPR